MKDSIIVKELVRSVVNGSKVRLKSGEDWAEGYLIGVDEHDFLLGALTGMQEPEAPLLILMINRRGSIVNYLPESTYEDEPAFIKDVLDEFRERFLEHFADLVVELAVA